MLFSLLQGQFKVIKSPDKYVSNCWPTLAHSTSFSHVNINILDRGDKSLQYWKLRSRKFEYKTFVFKVVKDDVC